MGVCSVSSTTRPPRSPSFRQTLRMLSVESSSGVTLTVRKQFSGRVGLAASAVRNAAASSSADLPCDRAAANHTSGFFSVNPGNLARASYPTTVPRDVSIIGWYTEDKPSPRQAAARSSSQFTPGEAPAPGGGPSAAGIN